MLFTPLSLSHSISFPLSLLILRSPQPLPFLLPHTFDVVSLSLINLCSVKEESYSDGIMLVSVPLPVFASQHGTGTAYWCNWYTSRPVHGSVYAIHNTQTSAGHYGDIPSALV